MNKYLKFLFTKRPWAVIVNALILTFFTIGLPSFGNDQWEVHNLWEIEETWTKIGLGSFLLIVGIASLLQVNDEFKNN